jgi:hypothetical protein
MENLFLDYVNSNKIIDKEFITKLILDYKSKNPEIEDKLKSFNFVGKEIGFSSYNPWTYTMNLYYSGLINETNAIDDFIKLDKEFIKKLNLEMMMIVYHELVHAKQEILRSKYDEYHRFITKDIALGNRLLDDNRFFRLLIVMHNLMPNEYNANFEAIIEQLNFQKRLNEITQNEVYDLKLLKEGVLGYYSMNNNQIISPIELFYNKINYPFNLNDYLDNKIYNSLSEYDKIRFGFPISTETYYKIKTLNTPEVERHFNL